MTTSHSELLSGLSPEQADEVVALGTRMSLKTGGVLFELGSQADNLFVIERGRIGLTLPMQVMGSEEDVFVEERQAGQIVGWSALVPPHRFTLKGTALIDTELVALPRQALVRHFAAHPEVGYIVNRNLAALVGQRLHVFQAMWLREMQRVVELRRA